MSRSRRYRFRPVQFPYAELLAIRDALERAVEENDFGDDVKPEFYKAALARVSRAIDKREECFDGDAA
jgi:hypothetical protein